MRTRVFYLLLMVVSLLSCTSCEKGESPKVETLGATFWADKDSMVVTGRISSDGGDNIVSRGVCLSQSPDPTIDDLKVEYSGVCTSAVFDGKFGGIILNSTYYARAYAVNSNGVGYGKTIEVATTAQAFVSAKEASSINLESNEPNSSSATLSGTINPKNLPTEVWIEYGLSRDGSDATKVPINTFKGNTDVQIDVSLMGLTNGETYYFVIKAKNQLGEVTSNQMSFETFGLRDVDGNLYHTVKIGDQIWMKENLKTTRYRNGDPIPNKTENRDWSPVTGVAEPAYCWYGNDISNKEKFGALYNGYAATDSRIAPAGWHVPTADEYQKLIDYLGGWLIAGGKMKTTTVWKKPNKGADNSSKFSALPSGCRETINTELFGEISFYWLGENTLFWTNSQLGNRSKAVYIYYSDAAADVNNINFKNYGYSARLIKD